MRTLGNPPVGYAGRGERIRNLGTDKSQKVTERWSVMEGVVWWLSDSVCSLVVVKVVVPESITALR
jgi:hypothetical protein